MRAYSFGFRITAWTVIAFFSWTFLSLWEIPAALAAEKQKTAVREQTAAQPDGGKQKPEDSFEGILNELREKAEKASEKHAKGKDDSAEIETIKEKKTELASLDLNIRKSFAETEKKLRDAKLPQIILDRHEKFVRHYTENYEQLKTEIDDIEKAKTKADRKAKIEKARLHLEETRLKKRVSLLDPNNLPHQNRKLKGKPREPRTREQFERDFPKQKSRTVPKTADLEQLYNSALRTPQSALTHKPVLLAFNETASDIPFSFGSQPSVPQFALNDSTSLLLAQATTDLPTATDLSETPEIQFTDAIRAKAQELGCSPVRIYEEIRNSIEFVPTYGSIQGADMCLQTKQCNSFDTGSLLIAMLRSCSIPARYVYGTIEVPIEKVKNWVGGFSDPRAAVTFIASGGIPIKPYASGGVITKIQMETVWVEAWIDYIPSRGAKHKIGDTWIPLDASYKQYEYKKGLDVQQITGFDPVAFADSLKSSGTYDPSTGSITGINTALVQSKIDEITNALKTHVDSLQNPTIGDVIGAKDIVKEELELLPASLPYKTILVGTRSAEISDNLRHKITVSIYDPQSMTQSFTTTHSMPSIAGKRVTLAYMPATDADAQAIEAAGGLYNAKPYLIKLKPVLYIEGAPVAVGGPTTMGNMQDLSVILSAPQGITEIVTHNISVSTFAAIGLDLQTISSEFINRRTEKLEQTKNMLGVQDVPFDDIIGETLNLHALGYFAQVEGSNRFITSGKVAYLKHPSEMLASMQPSIDELWGIPYKIDSVGIKVDVKRYLLSVVSLKGDVAEEKAFMLSSGNITSAAEHAIFEETRPAGYQGISALKAISYANQQGIPIYTIDSTNINTILQQLSLFPETITNIQNAVAAGKVVTVPQSTIQYYDWRGDGYIIIDPNSGAGAYMITGGLAGGGTTQKDDPVVQASVGIIDLLNWLGNVLEPFAKALQVAGKAFTWVKNIGKFLAGITALATYAEMLKTTKGCQWNAIAAGLLDLLLNLAAGAMILWILGPAAGIIATIFIVTIVTIFFSIIESILLDAIKDVKLCYRYWRQNLFAQFDYTMKINNRAVTIYA